MEEKAQVSFEYLLTAAFTIVLAVFAAIIVEGLREIALTAKTEIINTRNRTIENIMR